MTDLLTALPSEALRDHVAILGTTGAGKTYAAKGEVEALLDAGRRVFVIDPTGAWWGLRLTEDGDGPSRFKLPIFGGVGPKGRVPPYCDVPIAATGGARLAELLAEGEFSGILDISRMLVGERTRLLTDFAETLAATNRRPLHLVIDESHLMLPQGRVQDPQSGKMLAAGNHLLSGGRLLGLRIMLLSQRAAKLHKDSLSMALTLVAMRSVSPQDRSAISDWIKDAADPKAGREVLASLPGLGAGEGWVWAPTLDVLERAKFRPITTFDSSATPDDDAPADGPKLGDLDLQALRTALAEEAAPAAAGVGGGAPKDLQAQLDRAFEAGRAEERRAAAARPVASDPAVQRLIRNAERGGALRALQALQAEITAIIGREVAHLPPYVADPNEGSPAAAPAADVAGGVDVDAPSDAESSAPPAATPSPPAAQPSAGVGEPHLRLLGALAWFRALGRPPPLRPQVAALLGWAPNGSTLRARLATLKDAGLVEYPEVGRVGLTGAGRKAAPKGLFVEANALTGLRSVLSGPAGEILDLLVLHGELGREKIAALIGVEPTGSTLRARLAELSKLDIVTYPAPGRVALSPWVVELKPPVTASLAAAADDFAPCAYPEGVWRMPIDLVLASSRSAYVDLIRKRQAAGGLADEQATVFRRGGLYFAKVNLRALHRDARAAGAEIALILQLHDWSDTSPALAPIFGKRTTPP